MINNDISNMDDFQLSIWKSKYQHEDETLNEWLDRISNGNHELKEIMREKKFLFGGRILANRGLYDTGRKVTYSNCYVLPKPEDNIESIFDTAKKMARTFSLGGGVGIDISNLRPNGAKVHNAALTTTGAISFMDLYNMTTSIIGQRGRRGALMISMDVSHPDIEEFVDLKTDLNKINKANTSVRVSDEFMECVVNNKPYTCSFVDEYGNEITKEINAKELFMKLCKNNWDYAEPGILFWDTIENSNLLSFDEEFEYAGVNPCAEEPLPAGGSCLLGSINLSEFVKNPFTDEAYFDLNEYMRVIDISVVALNEVLEEGLNLHPLAEQRESVYKYKQIGLGVMGIADMLIKLGIRYGSKESIKLCDELSHMLLNKSLYTSAMLAKKYGAYPKYKKEAIKKSLMYGYADDYVKDAIDTYGLRNSQLLTIPPTGSTSNLIGTSGGIEPIFNISYTRKTESLHEEDTYYKVFTPVIKELMEVKGIDKEEDLPDYVVTAMTLYSKERIKMQGAWQKYIDASISSTINLPYEATVEEVHDIYVSAWENKLKGITIYRDGCRRSGILINNEKDIKENVEEEVTQNQDLSIEEEQGKCTT